MASHPMRVYKSFYAPSELTPAHSCCIVMHLYSYYASYHLIFFPILKYRKIVDKNYEVLIMLEHIFRNINDIRIFDVMVEFVLDDKEEKKESDELLNLAETNIIDFDGIMDMLDYRDYKRIEAEDSLDHLVRQKILGIKKVKVEGKTGCKICKYAEKLKIPRLGEHKKHLPEETSIGYIDHYYMKMNEITNGLRSGVFAHVFLSIEDKIDIDGVKGSCNK